MTWFFDGVFIEPWTRCCSLKSALDMKQIIYIYVPIICGGGKPFTYMWWTPETSKYLGCCNFIRWTQAISRQIYLHKAPQKTLYNKFVRCTFYQIHLNLGRVLSNVSYKPTISMKHRILHIYQQHGLHWPNIVDQSVVLTQIQCFHVHTVFSRTHRVFVYTRYFWKPNGQTTFDHI